jgi:hypothetical protein
MGHRWARWTLLVVAIAAAVAACGFALDLEQRLRDVRAGIGTVEARASTARVAMNDVRRALAAMSTPGQAAVGWSRRASSAIDEARAQMAALPPVNAPAAGPRDGDVLDRLAEAERRVREHAVGGKALMATDVAFGEAMPLVDDLERRTAEALGAAVNAADREMASLRDRQVAAVGGALGALLLAASLLAPLPRPRPQAVAPAADAEAVSVVATPVPDFVEAALVPAPAEPAAAIVPLAPTVDLPALAKACGELALVGDAQALGPALDRAAAAIGAYGAIVWLADADRRRLQVAATSGYDRRLVERLGAVDADDDNPTARAFTSAQAVMAAAREGRAASVAVPIVGPAGVVGVLSAELASANPAVLAEVAPAAAVVAAQLASLVAPAEPRDDAGAAPAQLAP